jgi:MOSC domain-containing protein
VARVRAIHLSPIKSLGLMSSERATVTPDGIAGDRAFVLLDDRGEVATMRRYGALARAGSRFDPDSGRLVVVLPDGSEVSGTVGGEEPEAVLMFGRDVQGTIVEGPWAEALSKLAGTPMRLMRVDNGHAQDTYPMSLLSQASLHELAERSGKAEVADPRRFRNTLLVDGIPAHEEDEWIGREVRAGEVVLRVAERDSRCSMTTLNPRSGVRDMDTLRMIVDYRTLQDGNICFGVYADVTQPGTVAIGDTVEPLSKGP